MTQAIINPSILSWARQRAGLDMPVLARKLNIKEDQLEAWERGQTNPTFKQAQNYAQQTFIPFGYLFLKQPPEDEVPIPDLRTVSSHAPRTLSLNLRETIRDVMQRHIWYREYQLDGGGDPVSIVESATVQTPVDTIVADMKAKLNLMPWPERGSWEDYFRNLVARIEAQGVLVMCSSMVGSNTHRRLNAEEFRGFAITDDYAPVIFINTADCPEARLFTLIHELTHIWVGQPGISDAEPGNHRKAEVLCNAVAAEFLAPESEFKTHWQTWKWGKNIPILSAHFHVSQWVIVRRALTLELITLPDYQDYVSRLTAAYKAKKKDTPIAYGRMQTSKVSKRLAKAVVSEALSGRMLLRDAWQLIGIKPHNLSDYARKELKI